MGTQTGIARRRWEALTLAIAGLGLLGFGYPALGLEQSLPEVDPRQADLGVRYPGSGLDHRWIVLTLVTSLTIFLASGLPSGSLRSGRGSIRGALMQGLGGAVVACWTVGITKFSSSFYFTGTDDECTYADCWPLHQQELAFAVPGVLIGVVMIVMALLVNPVQWWVRAMVPVVVWVAALLVQHWVWTTYLVPVFEGPPQAP